MDTWEDEVKKAHNGLGIGTRVQVERAGSSIRTVRTLAGVFIGTYDLRTPSETAVYRSRYKLAR